jgi:1-deoxy-D-xylulose-5-phosphate reductoisomerase
VLNGANEKAVELFLSGAVTFDMIPQLIRAAVRSLGVKQSPTLDEIVALDAEARNIVQEAGTNRLQTMHAPV